MKKITTVGIVVLICITPLFRGLFYNYETYGFLTALALLSSLYFLSKIIKREPIRLNKMFIILSLLLVAAISFSFARALNPRENLETLLLYAELTVIYIVLFDYFCDDIQKLMYSLMIPSTVVGFLCAAVGLMSLTRKFDLLAVTTLSNRIGSTFQYSNTAAIYFAICLIFALSLTNVFENFLIKAVLTAMGNILLFALFLTGSRGGWLVGMLFILLILVLQPSGKRLSGFVTFLSLAAPVFVVLNKFNESAAAHSNAGAAKWLIVSFAMAAILSAVSSLIFYLVPRAFSNLHRLRNVNAETPVKKKTHWYVYCGAVAILVILAYVFRNDLLELLPDILVKRLERFASTGLRDGSVAARLVFYKDAMKLIADNWVTGLGGNGWDAAYRSVQDFNYIAAYVHSAYLQIFVDNGVFAFAAYTAIIVFAVVGALRFYISVKGNMHRTFAAGLICGLLALVLHSGFDFDLTYISLVLLLWAMFAAATAGTKPPEINGGEAKTKPGLFERSVISISGRPLKLILIIICSILFSSHAMYFTGAYNRQAAFEYMQQKDYKNAMVYYEEACRLDPANTGYTFELAKLYHYFGKKSAVPEYRQQWFEKAREAGEISVAGNVGHPDYMNTLVRIYLASEMPVEALLQAQKLVASQKNNAEVYELLAESYLAAYDYYTMNGDNDTAAKMLEACIDIDNDPYLRRSGIERAAQLENSEEIIAKYKHSKKLQECLNRAYELMDKDT